MNYCARSAVVESISTLQDDLAFAEENIATTTRIIAKEREVICELERHGHKSGLAKVVLAHFEKIQALYIADRNFIRTKLAKHS